MYSEKIIVNIWLQQNGFSVINNINAGRNRVIGTLAVKLEKDKQAKVQHLEVSCSVTKTAEKETDILEKFNNKSVVKSINQYLQEQFGITSDYEKVLVATSDYNIEGITVHRFENIFFEVMDKLDKQNYDDPIVRTLQLVKYLSMAEPQSLAKLLKKEKGKKVLKQASREQFLKDILQQKETKRILAKKSFEPILVEILKESSINKPEVLAKQLHENILKKRSKKKFLKSFLEHKEAKGITPKPKRLYKPLQYYLKKRG